MTNVKEIRILEAAQMYYEESMFLFKQYQESQGTDLEEILWAACEEKSGKADGLLFAYEILTGIKLYQHQIKEHIMQVA